VPFVGRQQHRVAVSTGRRSETDPSGEERPTLVVMLVGASTQLRGAGIVLVVVGGFAFFLGMRAAIARSAGESIENGLDTRADERRMAPIYKFVSSAFTALGSLLLAVGVLVLITSIF